MGDLVAVTMEMVELGGGDTGCGGSRGTALSSQHPLSEAQTNKLWG